MASPRVTRIYPSDRFPGDKVTSLNIAISTLMAIRAELGESTIIDSAIVKMDPTSQCVFEVWAAIPRTDDQVRAEQLAKLFDALKTAPREGLTNAQIAELLRNVELIAS